MASIVFPDLPIEAFYYNGQSEDILLEGWTILKMKNLNLGSTAQLAINLSVVWPPIFSSDGSTWLAIPKVKSGNKEKLEESQNPSLASAIPSVSGSTNYVDAVREGLKKSMMTYAFSASEETEYMAVVKEGLEKPRKAFSSYYHETITKDNVAFANPDQTHSIASPYFDNGNSIWLNMRDTGKTESIITEAMSNMTMDMEDVPNEHFAFDRLESEASIEVIDSHDEDFGTMDEI